MEEVISKKQYTLKLKPLYFLATKFNVFVFIVCFFFCKDTQNFLMIYPPIAFLLYRFIFKENRLSNPYSIFLFKHYSAFLKILRRERKENVK